MSILLHLGLTESIKESCRPLKAARRSSEEARAKQSQDRPKIMEEEPPKNAIRKLSNWVMRGMQQKVVLWFWTG